MGLMNIIHVLIMSTITQKERLRAEEDGILITHRFSFGPMSWIRLAASCRYLNSFSGSTPSAREGELASCSLVKYQRRCGTSSRSAAIFLRKTTQMWVG